MECTKKHHITRRLITKTPRELVRWLQQIVDDDTENFDETFDLDSWEARRAPRHYNSQLYRPAGYHWYPATISKAVQRFVIQHCRNKFWQSRWRKWSVSYNVCHGFNVVTNVLQAVTVHPWPSPIFAFEDLVLKHNDTHKDKQTSHPGKTHLFFSTRLQAETLSGFPKKKLVPHFHRSAGWMLILAVKISSVGWLVDQPFSKRYLSHWTVVCSQLSWRTDCYARWIQFELFAGCEVVRALATSTRNLESANLIFFLTKNLALIESTSTPATTQACNSLGWRNWTMPHAGEILWTWSLALRAISPRTFCAKFCPSILQSANWTLQIDVTLLHVDGTITNHKEIGLGSLLPSWFQGYLFILPSWQAWALMGLDCIHWILQQNLRIQRQVPEQKLCHKARWFYGMATSRPFAYLEPSIAARSSGASFSIIE